MPNSILVFIISLLIFVGHQAAVMPILICHNLQIYCNEDIIWIFFQSLEVKIQTHLTHLQCINCVFNSRISFIIAAA